MSKKPLKKETLLVRHKTNYKDADPVPTPIFQASAFRSGDPYFYTRKGNPNFSEVEELFSELDQAAGGSILFSSGMASISAVLGLLKPGDRLIVHSLIYGCSYRFFSDYCKQMSISVCFTDISDIEKLNNVIDEQTKMVFFETPTNPFLKTINIEKTSAFFKEKNPNILVVVDNTWATPLFQNPLQHGADIVVYSCSKFFSGHSDIILGVASATAPDVVASLTKHRFYGGAVPDPFAAWLLRRSMQTLNIRLQCHVANTQKIAEFLKSHSYVTEIMLPNVDGKQLRSYGGMLFFRLSTDKFENVEAFVNALSLFDRGTSLASITSAVAIPFLGSHLSMTDEEKQAIGLDKFLIRLSIGIEDPGDLIEDLRYALSTLTGR